MIHPCLSTRARTRAAAALAAPGLALGAVVLTGAPATAHVGVSSPDAAPGGYAKVVLRVPNESEDAATTRVTVTLPEDAPFASVRTETSPGWTATVTPRTLPEPVEIGDLRLSEVPARVTWTADDDAGIGVDQFGELALSVGPLPEEAGDLTFATRQEYADGSVSDWSEPTPASGEEPEHPAPVLAVDANAAGTDAHGGSEESTADGAAAADGGDGGTSWTGPVGLGLGVVGVGLGGAALARSRRRGSV